MPHRLWRPLSLLLTLLLAACRPAATPTPEILADCFLSTKVVAWVDADGSGTREASEAPLAGVDVTFSLTFYGATQTGADGTVDLSGMYPGGCDASLDQNVVATAPEGYTPTTGLVQPYTTAQAVYEFGFQPAP